MQEFGDFIEKVRRLLQAVHEYELLKLHSAENDVLIFRL